MKHRAHIPNVQANRLVEKQDETFCLVHDNGYPVLLWSPLFDEHLQTERFVFVLTDHWTLVRCYYAPGMDYPVALLLEWVAQYYGEPLFMDECAV
jgi:hypothetical protein